MIFLFHSSSFIIFFFVVFSSYWIVPKQFKNLILLAASYVFYASWDYRFLSLIIISTLVDFICGKRIHEQRNGLARKLYLAASIIVNLSILGFFKYYNFFIDNARQMLHYLGFAGQLTTLDIILPIGISFYTFQTLSYSIDIYRRKMQPEHSLFTFALFVSFFPQLVAGPIERAKEMIPKLKRTKRLRDVDFQKGAYLFIYGLFLKTVLADSMIEFVDPAFEPTIFHPIAIISATYAFSIQIFCDFAGYSKMARGIATFFGIELSTNFKMPYLAKNPSDFWRRWHITLSSWAKDYIYIPLGGNRSKLMGLFPLLATMTLIGLWHGPAWHFIAWGVYWFGLTYIYRLIGAVRKALDVKLEGPITKVASVIIMYHLTLFGWIIFRSKNLFFANELIWEILNVENLMPLFHPTFFMIHVSIIFLASYNILQIRLGELFLLKRPFVEKVAFYSTLIGIYILSGEVETSGFIYFQF